MRRIQIASGPVVSVKELRVNRKVYLCGRDFVVDHEKGAVLLFKLLPQEVSYDER